MVDEPCKHDFQPRWEEDGFESWTCAICLAPRSQASAVERAAQAMHDADPRGWRYLAQQALTAALTNPDDRDELARALYVLDSGQQAEFALRIWFEAREDQPVKQHWRMVADGLRMILTGGGT